MVTVKITEMYDMSTAYEKLGLIGIHTPTVAQVYRRWHGLAENHRFVRLVKCNVRIACASMLPADPLQIGTDVGKVAPQDIMNPILYKGVTNESWDSVLGRLYASSGATINANSVKAYPNNAFSSLTADENERLYYTLLSSPEWKKTMPQQGLTVSGLKPLCYPILNQFGQGEVGSDSFGAVGSGVVASTPAGNATAVNNPTSGTAYPDNVRFFRGRARPLPRFPTCLNVTIGAGTNVVGDTVTLGLGSTRPVGWPRTYCLAVVMPPAKITKFYYRMIIDWYVEFTGMCTTLSRASAGEQSVDSQYNYIRTYDFVPPDAKLDDVVTGTDGNPTSDTSVDSMGVDPVLQMEK